MNNRLLNVFPAVALALAVLPGPVGGQTNSPGHALVFSGTNQDVSVPHTTALNAFPFTVMCWFRATSTNAGGLVNKYLAGSDDGYQIEIENGQLLAWYIDSSNVAFTPGHTLSGGVHNDGLWHHVGLSVDASGGRLYVDGTLADSKHWSGAPGPITNTQPVYLGYYPGITQPGISGYYRGELDEISLWNTALYQAQIQTYMNRSLTGAEPNLLAYWRLDEGSGASSADLSGNGHAGTLQGSPTWTNSDAPVAIVAPTGYTNGWAQLPGQHYTMAVASSADGLRLLTAGSTATDVNVSSDGGVTWQSAAVPIGYWDSVASSVHGDTLFVSQSTATTNIWASTNFGSTWQPITNLAADKWAVACSADAKYVLAASQGNQIAVSDDGGSTWRTTNFSGVVFHSVHCSSDGTHMLAGPAVDNIYYSTNSGTNWYRSTMTNNNSYWWLGLAGSADGRLLLTGDYIHSTHPLFRSTDYGVTWGPIPGSPVGRGGSWYGFASSADGSKLIATADYTNLYVSVDSGRTWQLTALPSNAYAGSPATSADGTRSFLGCYTAKAFASLTPPLLVFSQENTTNILLSWPNPSAGFNLQQSDNLTPGAWTNTPIRPAVAAGQNQVTLTNPSAKFFRLQFP